MLTNVSLGPCNSDEASKADFPFRSTPLTDSNSSPYDKIDSVTHNINTYGTKISMNRCKYATFIMQTSNA